MKVEVSRGNIHIDGEAVSNPFLKYAAIAAALVFSILVVALAMVIIVPLLGPVFTGLVLFVGVILAVILAMIAWFIIPIAFVSLMAKVGALFKR